jgi:hypothetical protein
MDFRGVRSSCAGQGAPWDQLSCLKLSWRSLPSPWLHAGKSTRSLSAGWRAVGISTVPATCACCHSFAGLPTDPSSPAVYACTRHRLYCTSERQLHTPNVCADPKHPTGVDPGSLRTCSARARCVYERYYDDHDDMGGPQTAPGSWLYCRACRCAFDTAWCDTPGCERPRPLDPETEVVTPQKQAERVGTRAVRVRALTLDVS